MSAARAGSTSSVSRRARTSALKSRSSASRMFDPRDAVQRREERAPASPLRVECFLSLWGEAIETAAARVAPLDPASLNEPAALEPVQRRIQRRDMELQRTVRPVLDQLRDLVAVAVTLLEQREDDGFGASLAQLAVC